MVDNVTDDADEEDIGRTTQPSSPNEEIVTNDIYQEFTSMLLNI